jgi:DNA-binding protein YbaB
MGDILDPDGALDELAAWRGRIDRLAADTRAMSDRLQELRVTATDDDRMVEVTVDAGGALVGLRLGRRIQQTDPDAVARAIMSTIGRARAQLAGRSRQIIEETVGTGSPAARGLAERVERRLRDG